VADFDPLHVGTSVQTCPGLAISNIRLKRALFNRLLVHRSHEATNLATANNLQTILVLLGGFFVTILLCAASYALANL
jgi:hypothetical protein